MRSFATLAVAVAALAAPALAHAAAPPIARPNPVTYPIRLDYQAPLSEPDGSPATLTPLEHSVIMAAVRDQAFLAFEKLDDLGGFVPAAVGKLTLTTGGHDVLSPGIHTPQIPLFETAGGGTVSSFTFTGTPPSGPTPPPDNGTGSPQPPPPPNPGNLPPPANQGFGGQPGGSQQAPGGGSTTTSSTTTTTAGGTTTTTKKPPPTTTGGTTTTTGATATITTVTGGGGGGGGGGGSGCSGGSCAAGSCGTPGIQIDSAPPGCVISISNAAPGDSVSEVMTITNTTGSPYTLSFRAVGPNDNHLWQDLQMDVYDPLVGPSSPMPPLQSWLGSFHVLTTLNPGATVKYGIELYLPTTAGNVDQGKSAVVTFDWSAG
jgi:hypothetical protein